MRLIVYYVGLMIVGDLAAYIIGLGIERMWGQQISLFCFLALYFFFLWLAWVIAVRLTEPATAAGGQLRPAEKS